VPPVDWRAVTVRAARAAMVLAAVGLAAVALRGWLMTTPGLEVRHVEWRGLEHADVARLEAALDLRGRNLLAADLESARGRLLAEAWVAEVSLVRVPPQGLRVTVTERVPVAVEPSAASDRLLAGDGTVLEPGGTARARVPRLLGVAASPAGEVAARRLGVRTLLSVREAAPGLFGLITSLDVSARDRLVVSAVGQPPIWVSGPQSATEVVEYLRRAEGLARSVGRISHVDCRWRHRLFLGRSQEVPDPRRGRDHSSRKSSRKVG
jgi:hypothetical protein